jgi:xylulokinase
MTMPGIKQVIAPDATLRDAYTAQYARYRALYPAIEDARERAFDPAIEEARK